MTRRRYSVALLAVAAVIVGGCSSGASGSTTSPEASSPSDSAPITQQESSSESTEASSETTDPAAFKEYRFAYANVTDASPLFKVVGDNMVENGKQVEVTVDRFDNNFDASKALENAQLMVQTSPDVVIDWTPTESIGTSIGTVFRDASTPCIAVNLPIDGCSYFNLVNKDLGIAAVNVVAPLMKERNWASADTTVIFLFAAGAGSEINSNGRYFYSLLADQLPGFTKIAADAITDETTSVGDLPNFVQLDGKAQLEESFNVMRDHLQVLPADRHLVVFTMNDDSALGALRAIEQDGRNDDTMIVSQGANAEGLKQLRTNPVWVAEGSVFFELWSDYLLAMGVSMMNGVTPPELTTPPQMVMSKTDVDKYYDADNNLIAKPLIPEGDQYLLASGVLQALGHEPNG